MYTYFVTYSPPCKPDSLEPAESYMPCIHFHTTLASLCTIRFSCISHGKSGTHPHIHAIVTTDQRSDNLRRSVITASPGYTLDTICLDIKRYKKSHEQYIVSNANEQGGKFLVNDPMMNVPSRLARKSGWASFCSQFESLIEKDRLKSFHFTYSSKNSFSRYMTMYIKEGLEPNPVEFHARFTAYNKYLTVKYDSEKSSHIKWVKDIEDV